MILLQLCGTEIIPLVVNVPSILRVPSIREVVTSVTAMVYYILGAVHLGHNTILGHVILMLCMMVVISELQVCFGLELMVKNKERQKRERKSAERVRSKRERERLIIIKFYIL